MYIRFWAKDATSSLFENTKTPWSKDKGNPYGPYYAELSRTLNYYDNPWNCQMHGTVGPIPNDILSEEGLYYYDEKGWKTRAFTHGCTRFNNKVIEMLKREAPVGTKVHFNK